MFATIKTCLFQNKTIESKQMFTYLITLSSDKIRITVCGCAKPITLAQAIKYAWLFYIIN